MEAQAKAFITSMDKNGNGTLSKDEVPGQMTQFFDRIDMDKNGEVDPSEAAIIVGRMSGRRGRGGLQEDTQVHIEKLVPQPQLEEALGFSMVNRAPISSSVKSITAFSSLFIKLVCYKTVLIEK